MTKVLIIGSKGFIGSHTTQYFKKNYEVWECDVVTDYANPQYYLVDATNADYSEIFREQQFDACINCSGAASVPDSLNNPARDYHLNVTNVFKLLDAIRLFNPDCKFINLSSAAVYGNPDSLPVSEKNSIQPLSPYGFHKLAAEGICTEFSSFFNLNTCNMRIFSAYGSGLQKQLFWDLFQKTSKSNVLELFGTGKESRDFIYISDLVQQIELVLKHSTFNADYINAANGEQIYIADAVKIFVNAIGWQGEIKFIGTNREGDPLNWQGNIDRMIQYGYSRKLSFEEGIRNYVTWLKEKR